MISPRSLTAVVLAGGLAAGCGGGHDPVEVSGTAAVGAALQGATVTVRDASGNVRSVQSEADGGFKAPKLNEGALMVRCEGGMADGAANGLRLHGLVLDGRIINCTPLTELALWKLLGHAPSSAFDGFAAYSVQGLTADAFAAAEAAVLASLADGAGVDINPAAVPHNWNKAPLAAGSSADAQDAALDALRQSLLTDQTSLDAMGDIVLRGLCAADGVCS